MAKIKRGTAKRRRKTTRIVWSGNVRRRGIRASKEVAYVELVELSQPNDSVRINAFLPLRSDLSIMRIESS
jgi:hypothetical protein